MFGTAFAQLTGLLEKRFVVGALLPALAFSVGVLLLGLVGTIGVGAGAERWSALEAPIQWGLVILALVYLYVLAALLASQTYSIVRMFEGYHGPFAWFGASAVAWHGRRRAEMAMSVERYDRRWQYYPSNPQVPVLPTRLGNVMRSGEAYSHDRYGVDAVVAWPRLYQLLPPEAIEPLGSTRASLEQLLILATLSICFAVGGSLFLAFTPIDLGWALACLFGGLLVARLMYSGALGYAVAYSGQLRAVMDLHRLELLDALHVPRPRNRTEEERRWTQVMSFLHRNNTLVTWPYETSPEDPPNSSP